MARMLPGPRFLRHFSGGAKNAFKGLRWPLHRPSSGLRQKEGGEGGPDFPDLTGKEGNFRKAAAVATRRPPRANQGPRKLAPQTSKIVRTRGRRKATGGPKIHNREVHSTKSKTSPRDVLLPGPERVKEWKR